MYRYNHTTGSISNKMQNHFRASARAMKFPNFDGPIQNQSKKKSMKIPELLENTSQNGTTPWDCHKKTVQ